MLRYRLLLLHLQQTITKHSKKCPKRKCGDMLMYLAHGQRIESTVLTRQQMLIRTRT